MKKPKNKKLSSVYFRLILSVITWIILTGILFIPAVKEIVHPMMINFTGKSLLFFGNIFGFRVAIPEYPMIEIFYFRMKIVFECTAFNYFIFAFALVLFSKWTIKRKLINFLIYIFVIYILNLMRFFVMGWVGRNFPDLFENIHNYFWNIFFALVVLVLWVITNEKVSKDQELKEPQNPILKP